MGNWGNGKSLITNWRLALTFLCKTKPVYRIDSLLSILWNAWVSWGDFGWSSTTKAYSLVYLTPEENLFSTQLKGTRKEHCFWQNKFLKIFAWSINPFSIILKPNKITSLGKTPQAFSNLSPFMERYFSWTNLCHGCGQIHGEDKVMKKCAGCKSAFYCNKLCQTSDWIGEGDPLWVRHKYVCPLLRFLWKAGKREFQQDPFDSKSISRFFGRKKISRAQLLNSYQTLGIAWHFNYNESPLIIYTRKFTIGRTSSFDKRYAHTNDMLLSSLSLFILCRTTNNLYQFHMHHLNFYTQHSK